MITNSYESIEMALFRQLNNFIWDYDHLYQIRLIKIDDKQRISFDVYYAATLLFIPIEINKNLN